MNPDKFPSNQMVLFRSVTRLLGLFYFKSEIMKIITLIGVKLSYKLS